MKKTELVWIAVFMIAALVIGIVAGMEWQNVKNDVAGLPLCEYDMEIHVGGLEYDGYWVGTENQEGVCIVRFDDPNVKRVDSRS